MRTPHASISLLFPVVAVFFAACASPQQRIMRAALGGDETRLSGLLRPGADLNAAVEVGETSSDCPESGALTPLQGAACAGRVGAVRMLLDHQADPNAAGAKGHPPLIFAIVSRRADAARLLIERGAKAGATDASGHPALALAAANGQASIVELLLDHGAEIDAADRSGRTALMAAPDRRMAELLLSRQADLSRADNDGDAALHAAAKNGRADVVRLLLERGADSEARDKAGATPLALARAGGHAGAASVLEEEARRLIGKQLASGDKAAIAGDQGAALSVYAEALRRAVDLGGELDWDIRVKIVKYVAGWSAPPALPEAAREHLVRADYYLKNGRGAAEVAKEMAQTLDAAPWWAEGYYNLGLVQASQNRFKDAARTFKLFIEAAPHSPKAQTAQDKIFELKIAQEEADKVAGMAGSWNDYSVAVDGGKLTIDGGGRHFSLTMKQDLLEGSVESQPYGGPNNCTIPGQTHPVTGKVSDDRRAIDLDFMWSSYDTRYHCVDMFGMASNCCLLCSKVCDAVSIVATTGEHVRLAR